MRLRTILPGVIGCLATTSIATAVLIGNFPGFHKLIEDSDAIVILRIDHHVDLRSGPALYTIHDCYIYRTLKGDLPAGKTVRLQLMDTRTSFVTPYAINSTHLMFLAKSGGTDEPTMLRTIAVEGANIRLSPFGHERRPDGKTLEDQIKSLVRGSLEYWRQENEKERLFLNSVLLK